MADSLTIVDLIKQSHETALDKGWWDEEYAKDQNFGSHMILAVGELSEAYEEYRNNRGLCEIYYKEVDGLMKPEGIPVEIADAIIRLCDVAGHDNIPLLRAIEEKLAFNKTRPYRHGGKKA